MSLAPTFATVWGVMSCSPSRAPEEIAQASSLLQGEWGSSSDELVGGSVDRIDARLGRERVEIALAEADPRAKAVGGAACRRRCACAGSSSRCSRGRLPLAGMKSGYGKATLRKELSLAWLWAGPPESLPGCGLVARMMSAWAIPHFDGSLAGDRVIAQPKTLITSRIARGSSMGEGCAPTRRSSCPEFGGVQVQRLSPDELRIPLGNWL